jgi:hypothetical protein
VRHLDGNRVETATLYELTDLGRSLDAPLAALSGWVDANWRSVEAARQHGRVGLPGDEQTGASDHPAGERRVNSTLPLTGGAWKVSKQIVTDEKCAPGS